ncbi:MAG: type II toxin-antitoxin system VapC family toxin [Nanoarchaeota archaeon]
MSVKVIIDSNIFIASWHKRDQYSEQSIGILKKIATEEIHDIYITNYVVMEVVNFLMKKASFSVAQEALNYLTKTDRIHVMYVDRLFSIAIEQLFIQYNVLTITDCSLVAIAQQEKIKTIYSFDTGFDTVKSIKRLEK